MVQGRRREEGSGWGTRVYLWWIHVDLWQNQYNIVKLKNKIKKKEKNMMIPIKSFNQLFHNSKTKHSTYQNQRSQCYISYCERA